MNLPKQQVQLRPRHAQHEIRSELGIEYLSQEVSDLLGAIDVGASWKDGT